MTASEKPVFYDSSGRRWRRVRRTWLALAVFATAVISIFIFSVFAKPLLPTFNLRPDSPAPRTSELKPKTPALPQTAREQKAKKAQEELQRALARTKRVVPSKKPEQMKIAPPPAIPPPAAPTTRPLSIGFYINWDESSYSSLQRNLDHLDWVVPQWVYLQEGAADGSPISIDMDPKALNLIRETRPQVRIIPMVQNLFNDQWNKPMLARALADDASRQRLVTALTTFTEQNKFGGVCIDFEEIPEPVATNLDNLLRFMQALHAAFELRGLTVLQSVPFDNPDWKYKDFGAATDYLMLMAYDQHYAGKEFGPVAAQNWFEETLVTRMKELDGSRTIVAIGNYGYDWTEGAEHAKEVTCQEAWVTASESDVDKIVFDPDKNPHFEYDDENDKHHHVWFLDAVTAYNHMRAASGFHPAGFALWRLGSEDPSIWSFFGSSDPNYSVDSLRRIVYGYQVDFEGEGELLKVVSSPHDGSREIKLDGGSGFIATEEYDTTNLPSSYVIQRSGDHPGMIALTFDDGPDPKWTSQILDILKREQVPATFFVIGKNGQSYPDLLRREFNEGHEIGNHTFTHPNLGEIPGAITRLELNATQRLIESLTGRSTVLFRPPFFGDAEADTPEEVEPAILAQKLNYLVVGLRIDPNDWELPVTADQIVNRTLTRALDNNPETRGSTLR